jgi:hypothetical protein
MSLVLLTICIFFLCRFFGALNIRLYFFRKLLYIHTRFLIFLIKV